MSISCECDVSLDDGDGWYYKSPDDYSLLNTSKRKRCCSCNELIDIGATVGEFDRVRSVSTEVEERIYGDDGEVELASWYMCEKCLDLYYSITELGYCINLDGQSMKETIKAYLIDNGNPL